MHPILFTIPRFSVLGLKLGDWQVHSFGVMMVIAFFAGLWLVRKRSASRELDPNKMSDLMFWVLIAGVLGARALYLLQEYKHYAAHPSEIFTLQFAGLTSFGGIIFGFAMVFLWCRRHGMPVLKVLDVAGPALLLGHAIGRIGCLLNGCCAGGACPADLPWGVHIDGVFVHPAQAYDSLMTFAALGIALFIEKRGTFTGQMISVTFMLYGLSRFIYEFWRAGVSSTYMGNLPITDAQAAALFMILLGAVMYSVYWRKARVQPTDEPPIKVVAA